MCSRASIVVAVVVVVATGHLDVVIHVHPPVASCPVDEIDLPAGAIKFDFSVGRQIDIEFLCE